MPSKYWLQNAWITWIWTPLLRWLVLIGKRLMLKGFGNIVTALTEAFFYTNIIYHFKLVVLTVKSQSQIWLWDLKRDKICSWSNQKRLYVPLRDIFQILNKLWRGPENPRTGIAINPCLVLCENPQRIFFVEKSAKGFIKAQSTRILYKVLFSLYLFSLFKRTR